MGAAFLAHFADFIDAGSLVPEIAPGIIEKLLSIMSAAMLPIATFAVASMISAYNSASSSATPRVFPLIVADDVSKTALSSFVAAFIFSVVALIAVKSSYYGQTGYFVLFVMTLGMFAWIIAVFVRWVDSIARLGRMETTIVKIESATRDALVIRRRLPNLGGVPMGDSAASGNAVYGTDIGYIQHINMRALQDEAEVSGCRIALVSLPGTFAAPGRPLAYIRPEEGGVPDMSRITDSFLIGNARAFEEDPRFGIIAMSEIAARALSLGINDPGTAISIIGSFVRLLASWAKPLEDDEACEPEFDRVEVPGLSVMELFDDAFIAIARDGAGMVEVGVRLQKAFLSLVSIDDAQMKGAARHHAGQALARAERAMTHSTDIERIRALEERVRGA
ncbi:MAG: DUF2254 domain-containing protein [Alphaproteobacteria bacterium]